MAAHCKILEQGSRRWFSVEGAWEPRLTKIMESHGLKDLRFYDLAPDGNTSVDFLRDLPTLERLSLCVNGPDRWSALYQLSNLRVLEFQHATRKVDFTRMPRLEHVSCSWKAGLFSSLCDCEWLTKLAVDYFSAPDFRIFGKLKALRQMDFGFARVESLLGMERFPELRRLELGPLSRLETLEHLEQCGKLEYLGIHNAKKLRSIDAVGGLTNLQELFFKACPKLESLRSLEGLPNLEYFGLLETTTLADGDLSVLKTIPKLKHASIRDRKHYTHSDADFPKSYRRTLKLVTLYED